MMSISHSVLLFAGLLFLTSRTYAQVMAINHNRPIVVTRLDPIVSPGGVASHMHTVVGGSRFKSIYDPADLVKSKCTTADVPKDFSNYWSPSLYFKWNNGSIGIVNHAKQGFRVYYNNRFDDKDTNPGQVYAFPPGFSMLGGNPKIRATVGDATADSAQSYACLGQGNPETPEFPSKAGKDYCTTIRAQIHMPNCWDGVRATSADNSHVSYPIGNNAENGHCPPNFKRIPSLFYENFYDIDNKVMNSQSGEFVLSNGDTEGFAMHGDFTNGWEQDLIEQIVKDCYGKTNDGNNCAIIKQSQTGSIDQCDYEGEYVDEETGRYNFVQELPGCIGVGTGPSGTCAKPNIVNQLTKAIVLPGAPNAGNAGNTATTPATSILSNPTLSSSTSMMASMATTTGKITSMTAATGIMTSMAADSKVSVTKLMAAAALSNTAAISSPTAIKSTTCNNKRKRLHAKRRLH